MSIENAYDSFFKFLLVGDFGVGKSKSLLRYSDGIYNENRLYSIGSDFKTKMLMIDRKRTLLQIWDIIDRVGERGYGYVSIRGVQGIILAYSITDRQSFESLPRWMEIIDDYKNEKAKIILVGTKCDDENGRQVSTEEGKEFAEQMYANFCETSAKTNKNIEETFNYVVTKAARNDYFIYRRRKSPVCSIC